MIHRDVVGCFILQTLDHGKPSRCGWLFYHGKSPRCGWLFILQTLGFVKPPRCGGCAGDNLWISANGFRQTSCVVEGSVFAGHWINRQLLVACAFVKNRILYRVLYCLSRFRQATGLGKRSRWWFLQAKDFRKYPYNFEKAVRSSTASFRKFAFLRSF